MRRLPGAFLEGTAEMKTRQPGIRGQGGQRDVGIAVRAKTLQGAAQNSGRQPARGRPGAVLAIRLFANMLAGHTALFIILFFIQYVSRPISDPMGGYLHEAPGWLYYLITPVSVALSVALSCLELLVAGLQAFVFALLTSTFIGLAKHPAH